MLRKNGDEGECLPIWTGGQARMGSEVGWVERPHADLRFLPWSWMAAKPLNPLSLHGVLLFSIFFNHVEHLSNLVWLNRAVTILEIQQQRLVLAGVSPMRSQASLASKPQFFGNFADIFESYSINRTTQAEHGAFWT